MKFEKKTVYRAGSIFIVSVVISIAVFLSDRGAGLERNQNGQVVLCVKNTEREIRQKNWRRK